MSPSDRPRDLLALAENDYQAALILARAENPQTDAAGFHLQQAAESRILVKASCFFVSFVVKLPVSCPPNPLIHQLTNQLIPLFQPKIAGLEKMLKFLIKN